MNAPSFSDIHNAILDEMHRGIPFPYKVKATREKGNQRLLRVRQQKPPKPPRRAYNRRPKEERQSLLPMRLPLPLSANALAFRRKKELIRIHKLKGCAECGYKACSRALEFHHLDPAKKLFTIGSHGEQATYQELVEEIAKCRILCCNCHTEVHAGVRILPV